MEELLLAVAKGLVEDKDAVKVTVDEANEDGIIVYHLTVAEDDMGRVIGKQGRIAKAIRVVMPPCAKAPRSWWRSAKIRFGRQRKWLSQSAFEGHFATAIFWFPLLSLQRGYKKRLY